MPDPSDPSTLVLFGIIGGAHGIKGEVRVKSYTEEPEDLGAYGSLSDEKGNRYTVVSARAQKNVLVVRFEEVRDRNHAERLNGTELFVPRSALPDEDDGEEFYQADLVGLVARTTEGVVLGEVTAFHNFGAGDILEIAPEDGASLMVPFSEAAVPEIDLDLGYLLVEPVAAGLKDAIEAREDEGDTGKSNEEEAS